MHVVIADQLSSSAIEILRTVPGFTVDARPGRPAAELAQDLADADALIVRSATQVDAKLIAAAPRLRVEGTKHAGDLGGAGPGSND